MLDKTLEYINYNILVLLFALGLSLDNALLWRRRIIGFTGAVMLTILVGNLLKILYLLQLPYHILAIPGL